MSRMNGLSGTASWSRPRRGLVRAVGMVLGMGMAMASLAAEWQVRQSGGADFTAVQAAIDAAAAGDIVTILDSATYVEDLSFGLLHPSFLNAKANVTLRSADGERPTIQALNTSDRFGLGAPDFSGVLVLSSGVTLQGLNILNNGDASGSSLGVGTTLSIHASNVQVMDCDLSQVGGTAGSQGATVASVSDFGRLAGGPDTVENVVFSDCVLHDGTGLGMTVFPFSFNVNPAIVGSVHHVRMERCVIRDCSRQGFETDGLGSVTLVDVTSRDNAFEGIQLSIQHAELIRCEALDNGGIGVDLTHYDVGGGDTVSLTATDLTCIGNQAGGLQVSEGTAVLTNLVCASNENFNVRLNTFKDLESLPDVTLEMDHATLYYPPGDLADYPNVITDGGLGDPSTLQINDAILVGPVGIDNFFDDVLPEDLILDTCMFWNGGASVVHFGGFTEVNPVTGVDPLLVDPANRDYRLSETSPVGTADSQGGPLGGAGIVKTMTDPVALDAVGFQSGMLFLEWQGTANLTFDIYGGPTLPSDAWTVLDSVPGAAGTQHWEDPRAPVGTQFYRVESR